MSEIGKRIRRLRMAKGVSQVAAAEMAGIHNTHLSKVEKGDDGMSLESLARLAVGLGCSLEDLTGLDSEFPGWELVQDTKEKEWLRAFRRLPDDQKEAALSLLARSLAA